VNPSDIFIGNYRVSIFTLQLICRVIRRLLQGGGKMNAQANQRPSSALLYLTEILLIYLTKI
jgi:hypothetical protein